MDLPNYIILDGFCLVLYLVDKKLF